MWRNKIRRAFLNALKKKNPTKEYHIITTMFIIYQDLTFYCIFPIGIFVGKFSICDDEMQTVLFVPQEDVVFT